MHLQINERQRSRFNGGKLHYVGLDGNVQMLFLVGGAQMIVAEVVVAALLGHYFTAAADWVVPNDVGLAVLIIICIFVSGFAYR